MGTVLTVVCKLHLVLPHALPGGLLVCCGGTYIAVLAPARPPTMVSRSCWLSDENLYSFQMITLFG